MSRHQHGLLVAAFTASALNVALAGFGLLGSDDRREDHERRARRCTVTRVVGVEVVIECSLDDFTESFDVLMSEVRVGDTVLISRTTAPDGRNVIERVEPYREPPWTGALVAGGVGLAATVWALRTGQAARRAAGS